MADRGDRGVEIGLASDAGISASLANKMSIWPSSISCRKLSRWRSMQKLSDR